MKKVRKGDWILFGWEIHGMNFVYSLVLLPSSLLTNFLLQPQVLSVRNSVSGRRENAEEDIFVVFPNIPRTGLCKRKDWTYLTFRDVFGVVFTSPEIFDFFFILVLRRSCVQFSTWKSSSLVTEVLQGFLSCFKTLFQSHFPNFVIFSHSPIPCCIIYSAKKVSLNK